ncbi:MinD/ParA family protein [Spirillospora sp. NPDC029432]|uniref:MinD/ParA family ATP-binding protein n=1 Tax=Spirillospora sp. NPDC029432 TaxID=3154599 RepID=UPI003452F68A
MPLDTERLVQRNPHGDPALKRLGRGMRKALGASAGTDMRDQVELATRLGAPVRSCRRIAVTSIRGGAGKSTLATLIARTIQQHREDRVLAIDADPGLGSLPLRLGVAPTHSLHDVAATRPRTWDEAAQHLSLTDTGVWVLSAPQGTGRELNLPTFHTAVGTLGRYFAASIIDCGPGLGSPLNRGILDSTHAQVFVVPATTDGAATAQATLDWLRTNGHEALLTRTTIALVSRTPGTDLATARAALQTHGLPVIPIPYDRHLAAGTTISPDHLAESTHTAITKLTLQTFTHTRSEGTP